MSAGRIKKRYMNLTSVIVFVLCLLFVAGNTAFAYPYLQLDASSGVYVHPYEESIVPTDPDFTLYALVNSLAPGADLTDTFYISAAIVPSMDYTEPPELPPDLGSFTITYDSLTFNIDVVGVMDYGSPPLSSVLNPDQIAAHGVFDTYYKELTFDLLPLTSASRADMYNSMDNPGGPTDNPSSGPLYYQAFEVDVSGLNPDYAVHFDLYTKIDGSDDLPIIDRFAPFSHDVTTPVPGAVLLGLLGLGVAGVKLRKFA